jgi:hypothetical protein
MTGGDSSAIQPSQPDGAAGYVPDHGAGYLASRHDLFILSGFIAGLRVTVLGTRSRATG